MSAAWLKFLATLMEWNIYMDILLIYYTGYTGLAVKYRSAI